MVTYLDPHPSLKGWKRKRKADKSEMRKLEREKEKSWQQMSWKEYSSR
jgi:hypothetical protein